MLGNTIMACLWMASGFVIYYSVYGMFATHLQKDLHLGAGDGCDADRARQPGGVPGQRLLGLCRRRLRPQMGDDHPGGDRRAASRRSICSPIPIALVAGAFILQGAFLGAIYGQNPSYLTERFPTEVRATASGFCYHQGAIWAGFTGPVLTYFAVGQPLGFAIPMLIATTGAAIVFVITLLFSPETKGKELVSQITLVESAA